MKLLVSFASATLLWSTDVGAFIGLCRRIRYLDSFIPKQCGHQEKFEMNYPINGGRSVRLQKRQNLHVENAKYRSIRQP